MRPFSLRTRMILWLNAMTLVLGLGAGWVSVHWAGRAIARRALHEPAHNAARLIQALRLPCSDRLAQDLRRLTGCETAFVAAADHRVVASSLPAAQRDELAAVLAAARGTPARVVVGGRAYALGLAEDVVGEAPVRVLLLLPAETLSTEAERAAHRIAAITLVGILLTTLMGTWIAHSVTRPLRRLAGEAAGMAVSLVPRQAQPPAADRPAVPQPARFAETGAPAEVASLARSFNLVLARLEAAQQDLDHAARLAAIGQLAAAVVHEVRNPLCGIAMNARILADEAARRGQRDPSLDLIAREVERIDLYLKELLLLAAKPAPSAVGAAAPTIAAELAPALAAVAALVAGRCRHTGVELVCVPPAAAVHLRIESTPLRQVLLNLVLNALDALPNGGTIRVTATPGAAGLLRIAVADDGPGLRLPAGTDPFAPFVTSKPGGCGLGLHVSRRLVEQCGGRIGFAPGSPGGTVFWFELPVSAPPAGAAA